MNNLNKKMSGRWPLLVLAAVIFSMICTGLSFWGYQQAVAYVESEKPSVQRSVNAFMVHMNSQDPAEAYTVFSPRSRRLTPLTTFEEMLENSYVLFDGYESVTITDLRISQKYDSNDNNPQGTVGYAMGTILYENGTEGSFEAILEKEGIHWLIYSINVGMPQSKVSQ